MKHLSISSALVGAIAIPLLALSGCSSMPEQIPELDQARATVQRLETDPRAQEAAAEELDEARSALARADAGLDNRQPVATIRHDAYLARRHAEIGLQMTSEAEAQASIEDAEAKRTRVQLMAREAEAKRAQSRAERSQQRAERARSVAEAAVDETRRMADELEEMQAEETERGLVLTLSDVLFDTNGAELKAGSSIAMDRLANFLKDNPERRVLIEGHTDSRGSETYNAALSSRRARSVSQALMQLGIASDRLRTTGLGEAYPVASNDTAAGMQQNRRVEIVISDKSGSFPEAAERSASTGTSGRP